MWEYACSSGSSGTKKLPPDKKICGILFSMSKIGYRHKCQMDGCRRRARFAFDADGKWVSGRLQLCERCLEQITQLYTVRENKKERNGNKIWRT